MRSLFFLFTVAVLAADPSDAVCTSPFSEVADRCLVFLPDTELSWIDAQSSCDVIGARLAQIDTCEILGEISFFIAASGNAPTTGAYWIGASDVFNEGQFVWVNNLDQDVPRGVPFWGSNISWVREPNGGTDQNCVAIRAADNYHFHDEECDNLYGVLCEENNAQDATLLPRTVHSAEPTFNGTNIADFHGWKVTCPEGYIDVDGKCYLALSDALVTWAQGSVTCNLNGGRLAKVDQCDQLRNLSQFLQGTSPFNSYWIGFTDENFEGVYQYVDGTVADLPAVLWGQTEGAPEPDGGTLENCVELYAPDDYYLHDAGCGYEMAVLCEADGIFLR